MSVMLICDSCYQGWCQHCNKDCFCMCNINRNSKGPSAASISDMNALLIAAERP